MGGSGSGKPQGILRYYTDDVPGLKISPVRSHNARRSPRDAPPPRVVPNSEAYTPLGDPQVTVLVMSLCFIGFVTVLHAGAKVLSFRKS